MEAFNNYSSVMKPWRCCNNYNSVMKPWRCCNKYNSAMKPGITTLWTAWWLCCLDVLVGKKTLFLLKILSYHLEMGSLLVAQAQFFVATSIVPVVPTVRHWDRSHLGCKIHLCRFCNHTLAARSIFVDCVLTLWQQGPSLWVVCSHWQQGPSLLVVCSHWQQCPSLWVVCSHFGSKVHICRLCAHTVNFVLTLWQQGLSVDFVLTP